MSLPLYQKEDRTPANMIKFGSEILKSYSIEEPVKNAEILLSEVVGKEIPEIYLIKKEIPLQLVKKYINFLKKRIERIPLQYIVGKVDFYKYNFFVEEGVFIPRPETEILVGKAIEIYKRFFNLLPVDILDIGTGSGNIGVSLALEIEKARVFATDVSEKALKIAEKNACKYNVENKIKFIKSDLFPDVDLKFDIIISNPPYIPEKEIEKLQEEVKKEPFVALNGGKNGLDIMKRIIDRAIDFLKKEGFLLLEIGYNQLSEIEKIVEKKELKIYNVEKDYSGIERVIVLKGRRKWTYYQEENIKLLR